jgi:hypothetical protein
VPAPALAGDLAAADSTVAAPVDSVAVPAADSTVAAPVDSVAVAPADSSAAPVDSTAAAPAAPDSATTPATTPVTILAPPHAPDSLATTLHVETLPPGLEIQVDGRTVGRSPLSIRIQPRRVRIRAVSEDPRRFQNVPDATEVLLKAGASQTVRFDLRAPAIIRSRPEPATVIRLRGWAGTLDSLLGETPLTVAPSEIEPDSLRFRLSGYADTTVAGSRFLLSGGRTEPVALRRLGAPPPPIRAPGTPILKKRLFQWALIGVGSALCVTGAVYREKGDDAYERYLDSSNRKEIPDLYDETIRYDRIAAASLVTGQVMVVGGLVLLITGR